MDKQYTPDDYTRLMTALGIPSEKLAAYLGISGRTLYEWRKCRVSRDTGKTEQTSAARIKLNNLLDTHRSGGTLIGATGDLDLGTTPVITGTSLKKMRLKRELTLPAMAELIGVSHSQYARYELGLTPYRRKIKDVIATLWTETYGDKEPPEAPRVKRKYVRKVQPAQVQPAQVSTTRGKHGPVSTERVLDRATRFYNTHQNELNKKLVLDVTVYAAKELDMDVKILREGIASVLLIVKDRLTAEELCNILTGVGV